MLLSISALGDDANSGILYITWPHIKLLQVLEKKSIAIFVLFNLLFKILNMGNQKQHFN